MHSCVDAQHVLELRDEALLLFVDLADGVCELLGRHLHVHVQHVAVVDARDDDLVIRRIAVLEQHRLDLRREDVDALDDQHVVAAAHRLGHPDEGTAALAGLRVQHADVARTVADHREGFLRDAREDQLSLFAVGQHFARLRVDYLGNEVVLVDVHARLLAALIRDAGARQFREAVYIIRLYVKFCLDVAAHLLAPGLGAEDAGLELELVHLAALRDGLGQIGRVGGGAAEDGGAQVLKELDLTVRVA